MKKKYKKYSCSKAKQMLLLIYALFSHLTFASAQQTKIDSLKKVLLTAKEDTNKVNALNDFGWELKYKNPDSTIILSKQAVVLAKRINFKKGEARAYGNAGVGYYVKGHYPKALENYFTSLKIDEAIDNKKGMSDRLGNIGIVYYHQADYPKALDYYFRGLKLDEDLGNRIGIATDLGNIGIVYQEQADYPKALDYFFRALKMKEELGNKNGIASTLGNIGIGYQMNGDYPKAHDYYFRALKMNEELGKIRGIAINLGNIGSLYSAQKRFKEAEVFLLKALALDKEIGAQDYERQVEELLCDLYSQTNRHKEAMAAYKRAMILKDTLFSEENKKQMVRKEMNFEFEKKEAVMKEQQEKERAVAEEKNRRQQVISYSIAGGLLLVMFFAAFVFRSLVLTRNQKHVIENQKALVDIRNHEIEEQKKIVEEKNKDITDSINYAARIQQALLTSSKYIGRHLDEYFILFKPKDIVSGDFYWANFIDGKFFIIAADCTGHGVPGAFMSLLNISLLNEANIEKKITAPNLILDDVREGIIHALNPEGIETEGKDGMDCAMLSFDFKNNMLESACANNPIWIVRKNPLRPSADVSSVAFAEGDPQFSSAVKKENETTEERGEKENHLKEIKADKMPVGMHTGEKKHFTLQRTELQKGDLVYAFTDGYADQFGGPKGKKFKYKQLSDLLLAISDKPLADQKEILSKSFDDWKGYHEQVDDVLVIGVRV